MSWANKPPIANPLNMLKFALIKVSKNIRMNGKMKYTVADITSFILNFDNEEEIKVNNKRNDGNIIGAAVNELNKTPRPIKK